MKVSNLCFPESIDTMVAICYDKDVTFVSSTYNNHLKFGYGPELGTTRTPTFFNVQAGETNENTGSFHSECIRAARLIAEAAGESRLLVAMSGGLDSEVTAHSFLAAKVPFEAVIFKYENGSNLHDIDSAIEFCRAHDIKMNFIEINVLEFLNKFEYLNFTKEYFCNSPLYAVHLEACSKIKDGFVVIAGSPPVLRLPPLVHRNFHNLHRPYIVNETIEQFLQLEFSTESAFCFDHFFAKNSLKGVSSFFLYTPELILSSLLLGDPLLQFHEVQHFSQKYPHSEYEMVTFFQSRRMMACLKHRFYARGGFDVSLREAKFTGFEKIHFGFHQLQKDAGHYLKSIDGLTRFNRIYRAPMEAKMPPLKLIHFEIAAKDKELLLTHALNNWAGTNISIF